MASMQASINDFWSKFSTKKPSRVTSIFPRLLYASILPEHPDPRGIASAVNAAASYEAAAKECREKVDRIVRECHRTNEKFTDVDFDIESDLDDCRDCLYSLEYEKPEEEQEGATPCPPPPQSSSSSGPGAPCAGQQGVRATRRDGVGRNEGQYFGIGSVHRVDWIFTDPKFTIDGFSSSDINQGIAGDCWWLAAVATIAHRKDLMQKACVVQNEECGVYGFVFHRDGEWVSTVVDDNLYLQNMNYRELTPLLGSYDPTGEKGRKWRAQKQTGSEALYFAHCEDPNETWLPLLEKAYAKVHGEYNAIDGGWSGEAVEDMTGGVTSTISTGKVLSKDKLWRELASKNRDFVFALSAMSAVPRFWFPEADQASGLALNHAYSILDATEEVDEDGNKLRLVKIRNPWGSRSTEGLGEWNGRWSDGSKEWTPYWMQKLKHTFADDGIFWMLYEDVLENFKFLHRTRLFDEKWTVIQQWTSCDVAWLTGYSRTKFVVDVKKAGTVIIVLAQLDDRYFKGLEGQYTYDLHFLLKQEGSPSSDYICRVRPAHPAEIRSVNCEIHLEPGRYEVLPKITAVRDTDKPTFRKLIEQFAEKSPQKLRQVGMQYDLAHAKGGVPDEDQKLLDNKEKAKAEKKAKKTSVKVEVKIDIPGSSAGAKQTTKVSQEGEEEKFEDAAEKLEGGDASKADGEGSIGSKRALDIRPKDQPALQLTGEEQGVHGDAAQKDGQESQAGKNKKNDGNKDDKKNDENKDDKEKKDKEKSSETEGEKDESDPDATSDAEDEKDESRWNAVCVTCLRVYSQDPDLTITLVQPQTPEEASSSLVQGQEPAGATQ